MLPNHIGGELTQGLYKPISKALAPAISYRESTPATQPKPGVVLDAAT